jgi:hypothetical protein
LGGKGQGGEREKAEKLFVRGKLAPRDKFNLGNLTRKFFAAVCRGAN